MIAPSGRATDALDEALDESFPASDPPSMTATTVAAHAGQAPITSTEGRQELLETLDTCAVACMQALAAMASKASHNHCPTCCVECAAMCRQTADALARESPNADQFRILCAQICDWCAGECENHAHAACRACAEACRACAHACV